MCCIGMTQNCIRCSLRVGLKNERSFWGPGVAELLHQIEQYHSLRAAAQRMHMSYSKAWKIIHEAEAGLSFPLIQSTSGGAQGGGSHLTRTACELLRAYDETVAAVQIVLEQEFQNKIQPILNVPNS